MSGGSRDGEMGGGGAVETEMSWSGGFAPHRLEDLGHITFSISLPLSILLSLSLLSLPPLSPS